MSLEKKTTIQIKAYENDFNKVWVSEESIKETIKKLINPVRPSNIFIRDLLKEFEGLKK